MAKHAEKKKVRDFNHLLAILYMWEWDQLFFFVI